MATIGDLLQDLGKVAKGNVNDLFQPGVVPPDQLKPALAAPNSSSIGFQLFCEASQVAAEILCPQPGQNSSDPNTSNAIFTAIESGLKSKAVDLLASALGTALGLASGPAGVVASAIVTFFLSDVVGQACPMWQKWNANPTPITSTIVPPDIYRGV